jgi:hypothetical protein
MHDFPVLRFKSRESRESGEGVCADFYALFSLQHEMATTSSQSTGCRNTSVGSI